MFNNIDTTISDLTAGYGLDTCPRGALNELLHRQIEFMESLVTERRDELMAFNLDSTPSLKPAAEEAVTRAYSRLSRLQFEREEYIAEQGPAILAYLVGLYLRLSTLIRLIEEEVER